MENTNVKNRKEKISRDVESKETCALALEEVGMSGSNGEISSAQRIMNL